MTRQGFTVEEEEGTDLIADMQGEEQHQHAGGGVAPVMSGPVVVDVFKECWVEDLDLSGGQRYSN